MTPDTPNHYGTLSRVLHWGMAIAIACMYRLALIWHVSGYTKTLIPVHKALGTLRLCPSSPASSAPLPPNSARLP